MLFRLWIDINILILRLALSLCGATTYAAMVHNMDWVRVSVRYKCLDIIQCFCQ